MKIFCIGLSKTGTRSLHDALQVLGLRSVHWGGPEPQTAVQRGLEIRVAVERALQEGRPLLEDLEEADAYSDIQALSINFDVLDRQYPDSRFILTVRDLEDWLESRTRHVEVNQARREQGTYGGTFLIDFNFQLRLIRQRSANVEQLAGGHGDLALASNYHGHTSV